VSDILRQLRKGKSTEETGGQARRKSKYKSWVPNASACYQLCSHSSRLALLTMSAGGQRLSTLFRRSAVGKSQGCVGFIVGKRRTRYLDPRVLALSQSHAKTGVASPIHSRSGVLPLSASSVWAIKSYLLHSGPRTSETETAWSDTSSASISSTM
jgi:hypothetical protein